MQNKIHISPGRSVELLRKLAHLFLLIAISLAVLVPSLTAQAAEKVDRNTGTVLGKVVDASEDPIPGATVVLEAQDSERLTVVTTDDGSFAFHHLTPDVPYQVTVAADGFAEWKSVVTVEPEQEKTLTDVRLRILAVQRAVTVSYSSNEVAKEQLKAEEHQRILGVIPNLYVTYERHPEPLTSKMKFHLAYKSLSDPVFYARVAAWAGVQQANSTPDYGQGARGYGKRFGAGIADGVSEDLIGNAILPSLLHQDPRYFYQGTGTKWSRARHAMSAPFVCMGDNGRLQPNYSTWGGSLISSAISTAYYPDANRGAAHVFGKFGIGLGLHVGSSLAQEFILSKFTTKRKH